MRRLSNGYSLLPDADLITEQNVLVSMRRGLSTLLDNPNGIAPTSWLRALLLCLFLLTAFTFHAHAQGCAQCLDSTRATPPQVQAAYRHAILLMAGVAASLFVAGTLFLRNHR